MSVNAPSRQLRARNVGAALSLHHLGATDGDLVAEGHAAFGRRLVEIAEATIEGWL